VKPVIDFSCFVHITKKVSSRHSRDPTQAVNRKQKLNFKKP
jgi:hypothetical protein